MSKACLKSFFPHVLTLDLLFSYYESVSLRRVRLALTFTLKTSILKPFSLINIRYLLHLHFIFLASRNFHPLSYIHHSYLLLPPNITNSILKIQINFQGSSIYSPTALTFTCPFNNYCFTFNSIHNQLARHNITHLHKIALLLNLLFLTFKSLNLLI